MFIDNIFVSFPSVVISKQCKGFIGIHQLCEVYIKTPIYYYENEIFNLFLKPLVLEPAKIKESLGYHIPLDYFKW